MRDKWYADNRDLVKWSVLLHLAKQNAINHILQLAYYRKSKFNDITIDGSDSPIPDEVRNHFRDINNIKNISGTITVDVFDQEFNNRKEYLKQAIPAVKKYKEPAIIFLDPDTGLEPQKPNLKHVLDKEVKEIWSNLKSDDIIVLYQHRNRSSHWIETKHLQFSNALDEPTKNIKIAKEKDSSDVVFFYAKKLLTTADS